MMKWIKKSLLLFALLACEISQAQQPVVVADSVEERNFMPYELMYYKDVSNKISFLQVSSDKFSNRFQQHTDYLNKDFVPNASYWVRLPIRHISETQKAWLLEFYDQTIDKIDALGTKSLFK